MQQGPELFQSTYERRVGGTTWHWLGTALRLLPNDFRLRSRYGVGVDWPISYDDLEPWYGRAEDELGVSADVPQLGAPRSGPYPMPAIPQSYLDHHFRARGPPARAAGDADAAGAKQRPPRRPARLLRELELHPHLPDRREVRRDGARRARREARSSPAGLVRRTEGGGGKCRIRDISPAGRQRAHGHGPHARPRRKRDRGRS